MTTETQELTGTPKQIAWAEKIRAEMLAGTETQMQEFRQKAIDNETSWPEKSVKMAQSAELYEQFAGFLQTQTDAGFWIENRDLFVGNRDVIRLIVKGQYKLAGLNTRHIAR